MTENLWNAKRVAEFLGVSYAHFMKRVKYEAGMPKPLNLPGHHERWLADDWKRWAEDRRAA